MAVLRDLTGSHEFPLRGKMTVIGRDPACDIVVSAPQASGRHTMIVQTGGSYFVEDLDSVNGTYVNGVRIQERTRLNPGDRIEIHGLRVAFHLDRLVHDDTQQTIMVSGRLPFADKMASIVSSVDLDSGTRAEVAPEAKLRAILEISKNLGNALKLNEVLPKILESLFAVFPQADRGFVLLRDAQTGQFVPRAWRHRDAPQENTPAVSRTIIEHVLTSGRAVLSADVVSDGGFNPSQSIRRLQIRSLMCVPMLSQDGNQLGVLQLDTQDKRYPFRPEDLDVLVSASLQIARAVELATLHEERRELEAATEIQKSFLPNERPVVPNMQFYDYYSSAQHIGGDYYDYIRLPGNRLAVALGDVSGKGVSAALLMARLSAAVRFCLASEPSVPAAVRQLSNVLTRVGSEDRFITFVVAVLDLSDYSVTLVNAGHMPPLRRRAGDAAVEEIGDAIVGLPLAVLDRPYEQLVFPLEPGDTLVLYTDGVSEARNPENDLYGPERLRAAVQAAPEEVGSLGAALLADVQRFARHRPQADDLTIVCFGRRR
jgi:pSer/pThr/pTyr-binding forkhead associated (FHA) protein